MVGSSDSAYRDQFYKVVIALSVGIGVVGLGFFVEQNDFTQIVAFYGLMFAGYFLCLSKPLLQRRAFTFFVVLAFLFRFVLLFSFPTLSDDIYRFLWDGLLTINGINPFLSLPEEILQQSLQIQGLDSTLFNQLNSSQYYTIYPPVSQAVYALSAYLSGGSPLAAALTIKSVLLLSEVGIFCVGLRILRFLGSPRENVLIYLLNPLILIEICGNVHFEGLMLFFLLTAIYLHFKQRTLLSSIALAASVGVKLLPLMFAPLFVKGYSIKRTCQFAGILGLALMAIFLPLLNPTFLINFSKSLDLYFQKFEFNASLYYVIRWLGYQWKGYNLIAYIGPILGVISFLSILLVAWKTKKGPIQFIAGLLMTFSLYLFFTTTVHPWYLSTLIALCVFIPLRYPIIWSALIALTYINYSYTTYYENLWVVAFEYLIVLALFIYEWRSNAKWLIK